MDKKTVDYEISSDNSARFTLGKYQHKPLIVFGINPSVATKDKNDRTISIVEKIALERKCDGYLMLNIYPLRATVIDDTFDAECNNALIEENIKCIEKRIDKGAEIIAAWGTHICDRKFFVESLMLINEIVKRKNAKWIVLALTKQGHPHHPTHLAYEKMTFEAFDVDDYINKLCL